MKKVIILTLILIGILIILLINVPTMKVSFDINASIEVVKQEQLEKERKIKYDNNKANLRRYLARYNSPLQGSEDRLLSIGNDHRVQLSLLLAISRIESGLGQNYIRNNIMGIGGRDNMYSFERMEDSIEYAAELITTKPAYKRFQATGSIEDLGKVYCNPPENWIKNVKEFKREIEEEYSIN